MGEEEVDMEVEVVAMEAMVEEVMVEGVDMEIMEAVVVEVVEEEEWVDLCHSSRWSRS